MARWASVLLCSDSRLILELVVKLVAKAGGSWGQLVAAFLYAAAAAALVQMLGCYHSAVKTIEVYVNHI